ncbi:hypothetical protein DdX_17757 [Ditylenchus destructor]|uniref:Uncharacterized protein n=1 Tax=Ditylenchus destructor TaxID=166010 RepID=A0AAD4QYW5_9BILA|nr:hypothetical protein DdX_17757 [Ditylenchus destructor]
MFGFIAGSLATVLHYRIEPPTTFIWEVNLTIAGEGFVTVLLACTIFYSLKQAEPLHNTYKEVSQVEDADETVLQANLNAKAIQARFRSPKRAK